MSRRVAAGAIAFGLLAYLPAACAQPSIPAQADIERAVSEGLCLADVANRSITVYRLDGSHRSLPIPVEESAPLSSDGRVSADGSYVLLDRPSFRESARAVLGVAVDGRRLFEVYGKIFLSAALSADGRKIAFVDVNQLATYEIASKRITSLGVEGDHPSWAPDGKLLAYDDGSTVHTIDTATGSHSILGPGTEPWWTADGSAIAARRKSGKIDLIDVHSRSRREFLAASQVTVPHWSPNGEWFAYTRAGGDPWWSLRYAAEPHEIVIRHARSGGEAVVGKFYKAHQPYLTWVTNRAACQV